DVGAKPPAGLANLREVPVPMDPMTGQAFAYVLNGDRATLAAAAPPDMPTEQLRYELTWKRCPAGAGDAHGPDRLSDSGGRAPRAGRRGAVQSGRRGRRSRPAR